jgi:outer membrane lipoprotein LolB
LNLRHGRAAWAGRAALSALVVGLAGCQSLGTPAAGSVHATPVPTFVGRIAVQVEGDAQRSFSASFELQGTHQAGQLALSGPLGSTVGQLAWNLDHTEWLGSEGQRRYASLDALTDELVGEPLPVRSLLDWLAGRPDPSMPHRPWTATQGNGFDQHGWAVSLARRAEGVIQARREAPAPVVTVRVKLDAP